MNWITDMNRCVGPVPPHWNKKRMMHNPPLVIYHNNCADGFTSAWLANMYFREQTDPHGPDDAWYIIPHGANHGKDDALPEIVPEQEVYVLDFSYPPDVMDLLAREAAHVTVIDHHETAIRKLDGYVNDKVTMNLDTSRSGAYLTAKWFWPERDPGDMVKLVDDRDRWQFKDHRTRDFHASLFSRPYKIGEWNKLNDNIAGAVTEGSAIDRKHMKDIHELIEACMVWAYIGLDHVPVLNVPYTMASDAGHIMLERFSGAPYVATYYIRNDGKLVFSLRSRANSEVNVAEIAEQHGGGGHRNASGFAVERWPA